MTPERSAMETILSAGLEALGLPTEGAAQSSI